MIRLVMMLAAAVAMFAAGGTAHAKMAMQTFSGGRRRTTSIPRRTFSLVHRAIPGNWPSRSQDRQVGLIALDPVRRPRRDRWADGPLDHRRGQNAIARVDPATRR